MRDGKCDEGHNGMAGGREGMREGCKNDITLGQKRIRDDTQASKKRNQ